MRCDCCPPPPTHVATLQLSWQAAIKSAHNDYLASHPELKTLISDFMAALLMEKPKDVYQFATSHFAAYEAAQASAAQEYEAAKAEAEAKAAAAAAGGGAGAGAGAGEFESDDDL